MFSLDLVPQQAGCPESHSDVASFFSFYRPFRPVTQHYKFLETTAQLLYVVGSSTCKLQFEVLAGTKQEKIIWKLKSHVGHTFGWVNSNPQHGSDIISRQDDSLRDGSTSICVSLSLLSFTSYEHCPLITEDCKSSLFFFGVLLKVFKMAFSKL